MSIYYQEGRYKGQVTGQAFGKSSTGNPQFALKFVVLGAINPVDPEGELLPCRQYERTIYRSITEKTIEYFQKDLETLGFEGSSFKHLDPANQGFHNFAGTEFSAFCSHEEYKGEEREKWGVYNGSGSGVTMAPLEPAKVRELDNLFGKHLKQRAASAKPKQDGTIPAHRLPDMNEPSDDDVPF